MLNHWHWGSLQTYKRLLLILSCILFITGCLATGVQTQLTPSSTPNFCGKIVYVPLEGGFYGLESNKGNKYLPVNLPENLKQHGLSIQAKLVKVKGMMGLHIWGEYVRILNIRPFPC
jgi:hypothetical protein